MCQLPQPDSWDAVEKAMFVLLGWLLALLTSPIIDAIKRQRELKKTRVGVLAELAELKYRMALVTYRIEEKYGDCSVAFLKWVRAILVGYKGPMHVENIVKAVDVQLALSPENLKAYINSKKRYSKWSLIEAISHSLYSIKT